MVRAARRDPTPRELDERLTRVERQVAELATAMTGANEAAVREFKSFRDAFIEHRAEVRKAFAETATKADLAGLRAEVRQNHAEVMAQFEKLLAKPSEN
jgi:hypothetical protein